MCISVNSTCVVFYVFTYSNKNKQTNSTYVFFSLAKLLYVIFLPRIAIISMKNVVVAGAFRWTCDSKFSNPILNV